MLCCNRTALIELDKLQRLTSVVKRTGACIVLSTDWRRFPAFKSTLVEALSRMGLKVVGSTPLMASQRVRPLEISSWLRRRNEEARQTCWPLHQHSPASASAQRPPPTPISTLQAAAGRATPVVSWAAIDDRPLLAEKGGMDLLGHFVQTRWATGLNQAAEEALLEVLLGPQSRSIPKTPVPVPLPTTSKQREESRAMSPPWTWETVLKACISRSMNTMSTVM